MTDVVIVSADWFALRETADARSRSRRLADLAVRLHPPTLVHDLGVGTGAMMRWLAPRAPGPQTWVLHDSSPQLLEDAVSTPATDASGQRIELRTRVSRLADVGGGDLAGASLVTASGLLEILTRGQVEAIVSACIAARAPFLAALSGTGRVRVSPVDPGDGVFGSAFNDHQRRETDGGRLLGPDAVAFTAQLFRGVGWSVRLADSPWRLRAGDAALLVEWLNGWVDAAVEQRPALREWGEEYRRTRLRQLASGDLRVTVHHKDLVACPL